MTKKNIKPQQAAPVQREINTTSSEGGTGLTPHDFNPEYHNWNEFERPFAGDDAE